MNGALKDLWRRAEFDEPVFGYDEVHRWAHPVFDYLAEKGLLREGGTAEHFTCDNCLHPHSAEVIWISNVRSPTGMSPIITCPELGAVDVDPERLRQWQVDIHRLAELVAATLGLSGPVESVSRGLWALGRRHLAGRVREFFLAAGLNGRDVPASIRQTDRIAAAVAPVLLAPNRLPRPESPDMGKLPAFSLANLMSLDGDGLHLDIDFLEDALPHERAAARGKDFRSQPVPDDAKWSDLHLSVGETALEIRINGSSRQLSVEDLGFADQRKGEVAGDKVWQILRLFAQHGGAVAMAEIAAKPAERLRLQKHIGILRQRLQTVFPIQGDPIRCDRAQERYECAFHLRPMAESGIALDHGTSWIDVRITELPGALIQFQTKGKEIFAARKGGSEQGRQREAAERMVATQWDYSLEAMGMTRGNGQITGEGKALLAMLRSGGRLHRPGDDLAVLRLGERLRAWSGIEDDPFQFAAAGGLWVARFECDRRES